MTGPSSSQYFRAARALRTALASNRDDTDFATIPRRIIYLIDTNVAVSYLSDLIEREDRTPRMDRSPVGSLMRPEAADLSDALTYRYIFSGRLPGMQDGEQAFITQPHWDELITNLRGAADRHIKAIRRLSDDERTRLRGVKDNPKALLETASEIGLDRIIDQIRAAASYRKRLQATLARPNARLATLDHSEFWSGVSDKVSVDDVREWHTLLTRAGVEKRRVGERNIMHDARTLAIIEALYRENPRSIGERAQLRFVFVTADSTIRDAFRLRRRELAAQGIPDFVRTPLVYHPLLNFSAMHRTMSTTSQVKEPVRQVFLDVAQAIEALFPQVDGKAEFAAHDSHDNHFRFRDNIDRWSSAAEKIATANVRLFTGDTNLEPSVEEIASYFESEDLFVAVGKDVHATINDIEQDHARQMVAQSFERLVEALRQPNGLGLERRAPIAFPAGFDLLQRVHAVTRVDIGATTTLDHLLEQVAKHSKHGDTSPIVTNISEALNRDWKDPSIQLLAATIYMLAGVWDSAISCADRCMHTALAGGARTPLLREARYCKAVSLRMLLRSGREIEIARQALNENLAVRRGEPLILLRDTVERATLMLSACIVDTIDKLSEPIDSRPRRFGSLLPEEQLKAIFDAEVAELDLAIEELSSDFLGVSSDVALFSSVMGQAAINRLGAELYRGYFGDQISGMAPQLKEQHKRTMAILGELADSYRMPLMGSIYTGAVNVELDLGQNPQAVIAYLDARQPYIRIAQGDILEYDFLRARMAAKASGALRVA